MQTNPKFNQLKRTRQLHTHSAYSVTGFSLIEVLVTLVILSLGLLGVAGLLVSGISNAASSESTAKANQLAADIADRMRANPVVAATATNQYVTAYTETSASVTGSPLTIAQNDKKDWLDSLAKQLPDGRGKITDRNIGTVRQMNIEIRWNNCFGTLSDADKTSCGSNATTSYKTVTYELHL